jgi:hypothetical protein
MTKLNILAALLSASALISAQASGAKAPKPCITHDDFRAGAAYIMPVFFDSVLTACSSHLGQDAYLSEHGAEFIAKYQSLSTIDEKQFVAMLAKYSGEPEYDAPASENKMKEFVDKFRNELLSSLKPQDCGWIDRIAKDLSALPPENMLGLLETAALAIDSSEGNAPARSKSRKHFSPKPKMFCENLALPIEVSSQ